MVTKVVIGEMVFVVTGNDRCGGGGDIGVLVIGMAVKEPVMVVVITEVVVMKLMLIMSIPHNVPSSLALLHLTPFH